MRKRKRGRAVTIVIQRDGTTKTRTLRIPVWALRLGTWTGALAAVIFLLVVVLYGPLLRAAARVPGMERDLARLSAENTRVRELSAALDSAESRYAQVRQMMGGEIVRDPVAISSSLPIAPPIRARLASVTDQSTGVSLPRHWPLDEAGYITRGQVKAGGRDEAHPGIDIAVAVGNLVRASGGATMGFPFPGRTSAGAHWPGPDGQAALVDSGRTLRRTGSGSTRTFPAIPAAPGPATKRPHAGLGNPSR